VRVIAAIVLLSSASVFAESLWQPQRTSVGLGVGGRWTKAVELGGSGRAMAVSGAGPAVNLSGSFGWSRGALRLGGMGGYELMIDPEHDLDVLAAGPLLPMTESSLKVSTAHFFSLGPFVGAQTTGSELTAFADLAVLVDLMAVEIEDHGTRLGLRFVPTARAGVSVDMGFASFELWVYGSTLVTPRVGFCVAFGF